MYHFFNVAQRELETVIYRLFILVVKAEVFEYVDVCWCNGRWIFDKYIYLEKNYKMWEWRNSNLNNVAKYVFLFTPRSVLNISKNSMFAQLLSAVTSLQSTVKRQLLTRLDCPSLMFTLVCRCACESSYFILKSLKAYLFSSVFNLVLCFSCRWIYMKGVVRVFWQVIGLICVGGKCGLWKIVFHWLEHCQTTFTINTLTLTCVQDDCHIIQTF